MIVSRPAVGVPAEDAIAPTPEPAAAEGVHAGVERHSPSRTIARGALAILGAQPITWVASLLTAAFVPHFLGDRGMGQYAVAMTIGGLVSTLASLGLPGYLPRRIATQPDRAATDAGAALVLQVAFAAALAATLAIVVPLTGLQLTDPGVLRLALIGMIAGVAQNSVFAALNGQGRHARFAWLNAAAVALGTCASLVVLVVVGGVIPFMATLVCVNAVSAIVTWRLSGFRLTRSSFDLGLWREMAAHGWPFLAWELARRIRAEIDVVLVAVLLRDQVAGWLAAAYRIIAIPVFIPTLIVTPLFPALSRSVNDPGQFQRTLRRSVVIVLVLTTPISGMILGISPAVPDLLHWGSSFAPSVPLMMILAFQQPFVGLDMVLGVSLIALCHERRWLRVMVAGAVFNPTLNLVMIPVFDHLFQNGAIGAALTELATELVMFIGALILMPRGMLDRATGLMCLKVVFACACLVAVVVTLQSVSLLGALIAGPVVYCIALGLLRVVGPADLRILKDETGRFMKQRALRAR